jgi:hypothetical protein
LPLKPDRRPEAGGESEIQSGMREMQGHGGTSKKQ